jgi:hypothetical protein
MSRNAPIHRPKPCQRVARLGVKLRLIQAQEKARRVTERGDSIGECLRAIDRIRFWMAGTSFSRKCDSPPLLSAFHFQECEVRFSSARAAPRDKLQRIDPSVPNLRLVYIRMWLAQFCGQGALRQTGFGTPLPQQAAEPSVGVTVLRSCTHCRRTLSRHCCAPVMGALRFEPRRMTDDLEADY